MNIFGGPAEYYHKSFVKSTSRQRRIATFSIQIAICVIERMFITHTESKQKKSRLDP